MKTEDEITSKMESYNITHKSDIVTTPRNNEKFEVGIITISLVIDFSSVSSIVAKDIAKLVLDNSDDAKWLTEKKKKIKVFSNETGPG